MGKDKPTPEHSTRDFCSKLQSLRLLNLLPLLPHHYSH